MISINGSAARHAQLGDLIIIAAFAQVDATEMASLKPKVVFVDANNRITNARDFIPPQAL